MLLFLLAVVQVSRPPSHRDAADYGYTPPCTPHLSATGTRRCAGGRPTGAPLPQGEPLTNRGHPAHGLLATEQDGSLGLWDRAEPRLRHGPLTVMAAPAQRDFAGGVVSVVPSRAARELRTKRGSQSCIVVPCCRVPSSKPNALYYLKVLSERCAPPCSCQPDPCLSLLRTPSATTPRIGRLPCCCATHGLLSRLYTCRKSKASWISTAGALRARTAVARTPGA